MSVDDDAASSSRQQPGKINPSSALPKKPEPTARNAKLDSFESLMNAMDAELHKAKASFEPKKGNSSKPNPVVEDPEDQEDAEMEEELFNLLKRDPGDDADLDGPAHFGMIKNFLESFQSQHGAAGPVSNMLGVMNEKLPNDKPRNAR